MVVAQAVGDAVADRLKLAENLGRDRARVARRRTGDGADLGNRFIERIQGEVAGIPLDAVGKAAAQDLQLAQDFGCHATSPLNAYDNAVTEA